LMWNDPEFSESIDPTSSRPLEVFYEKEAARLGPCARAGYFLSVLPCVAINIYLMNTLSTTYKGGGTFFDVLAFCFYFDVARLALHVVYLLAPEWTLDSSSQVGWVTAPSDDAVGRTSSAGVSALPGAFHVMLALSVLWFIILGRLEAGGALLPDIWTPDHGKVFVLASINSCVFFALTILFAYRASDRHEQSNGQGSCVWNSWLSCLVAVMMLIAICFNAEVPNFLGLCMMLFLVFRNAYVCSHNLVSFIFVLLGCSTVALAAVWLSTRFAEPLRVTLHAILKV